jgi:adenosine deaminase
MPKAELHFHLEGAIPVPVLWELIQHHGGDPIIESREQLAEWFSYRDFAHFMETWAWMNGFLRCYDDFEFAAEAVARHLVAQNIVYVEAFFSPSDFRRHGLEPQGIAKAIRTGLDRVEGVEVALIVDLVRDRGPEGTARTLAAIKEVASEAGVIGIGIGGFELAHPPEQFAPVYDDAREAGFRLTAHAGEEAGPESVWGALRELGAERIGHGVRSIEDPELMTYLVEHQIPLEVCPTSNLRTGVVAHWDQHPVGRLIDAGVMVTINTDDPAMFDTNLAGEFESLVQHFGLGDAALKRLSIAVVEASWADDATRTRLTRDIEDWWSTGSISE